MRLKFSFIKLIIIYILIFASFDFFFGNIFLNLLYEKNYLINHEKQLKAVQENEKKFRIKNDYFHHTLKKNINTFAQWGPFKYSICTDEYGFRDICDNRIKHKDNIILIGDSFTEGIGLEYEKTFAGMMTKNWKINVKNLAVVSYSPIIYKNKIKFYLEKGIKTSHVIVFLDISDIDDENNYFHCGENNSVCAKSDNLEYKELKVEKQNENFPLYKEIKKIFKKTKRKFFPKKHIYEKDFKRSSWTYIENDKIIEEGINKSLSNMNELYEYLKKKKISLSIAVYPWPGQILHDKKNSKQVKIWRKFCDEKCTNFINLFPLFYEEIPNRDRMEIIDQYYLKNDVHFNESGHSKIFNKLNSFNFY